MLDEKLRYLKDVVSLQLNREKCIGCGLCTTVCPHAVFDLVDGKARLIDRNRCMECGACARNCPTAAITVHPGVGCASAIVHSWLTGKEPSCDCGGGSDCC
ncbi:MAG: 4Fe-4S binding protein [Desulfuromonadales bacterium]|nr:4Fe-4S binding protein [Desulfuromonadales bacterium]